jgi:hypothetical protein
MEMQERSHGARDDNRGGEMPNHDQCPDHVQQKRRDFRRHARIDGALLDLRKIRENDNGGERDQANGNNPAPEGLPDLGTYRSEE